MAKPKVISAANQKGGAGKSTTVYNLGACLALDGGHIIVLRLLVLLGQSQKIRFRDSVS